MTDRQTREGTFTEEQRTSVASGFRLYACSHRPSLPLKSNPTCRVASPLFFVLTLPVASAAACRSFSRM